jgi:hypothetical protein
VYIIIITITIITIITAIIKITITISITSNNNTKIFFFEPYLGYRCGRRCQLQVVKSEAAGQVCGLD